MSNQGAWDAGSIPSLVALFALLTISAGALAQMRVATDAEVALMRAAPPLEALPERARRTILDAQAAFTEPSGGRPARLDGWIYFAPYASGSAVCIMEAAFVTGLRGDDTYVWSLERFAYWNRPNEADGDCAIADRADFPGPAVQSSSPLPAATLTRVLSESDELLALAYRHLASSQNAFDPATERVLSYRQDESFRLDRIAPVEPGAPTSDRVYRATYRAAGVPEGPVVIFSVTQIGFLIHQVGFWTA